MIRLALKAPPEQRLSLSGLTPERLSALSDREIEHLPLAAGQRAPRLGDWFSLARSGDSDERLVIADSHDRLDEIGAGLRSGEILVEGDAGAYAGLLMHGGRIVIKGSAGYGAATAMRGGALRISGDAGDRLGGALPGERTGMSEGLVIVGGNAKSYLGDRMRRGTIIVAGAAGPFGAARLVAGTIIVGGAMGAHPGTAMRRGSLVALGGVPPPSPGFADCGLQDLAVVRLLGRFLAQQGFAELAARCSSLRRWVGDLAQSGKGEILAAS
jgi:formylmethanofuran dehydrogenase subunit C